MQKKNNTLFLSILIYSTSYCMDDQEKVPNSACLNSFPKELKAKILSFINVDNNYNKSLKELKEKAVLSKEWKKIIDNSYTLQCFNSEIAKTLRPQIENTTDYYFPISIKNDIGFYIPINFDQYSRPSIDGQNLESYKELYKKMAPGLFAGTPIIKDRITQLPFYIHIFFGKEFGFSNQEQILIVGDNQSSDINLKNINTLRFRIRDTHLGYCVFNGKRLPCKSGYTDCGAVYIDAIDMTTKEIICQWISKDSPTFTKVIKKN